MPVTQPGAPICNEHGERLDTVWTAPAESTVDGVCVIGHGVTSHHDRPWLVALSDALAERGVASLRMSFSGNGASEGLYEDSTISKEVRDLRAVLDALAAVTDAPIVYAGHSMGGAVGVRAARSDSRITALVSLAGMAHVQAFVERHFGGLVAGRDVLLGKPHCPLSQAYLDDCAAVHDVIGDAAELGVPWLLLHGDADELVPLQDAKDLVEVAPHARLHVLPDADHRFSGCEHQVAAVAADWVREVIGGGPAARRRTRD